MALDYTTKSGDTWDLIALNVYGSELKADWLMQNNPRYTKIVCKEGYTIHIYFLMAGGRVPTREECTGMQEYFDTVKRPMGDLVLCHAPEEIPYDIELTYHIALSNVKNASTIQENVEAAVKEYETWQRKIGRDIEPAELIMRVREAGAKRPRLLTPVETTVSEIQVAKLRSCKVTYGGIEDG